MDAMLWMLWMLFQNVPIIHGRYEADQKCCSSPLNFRTRQLRNLPLINRTTTTLLHFTCTQPFGCPGVGQNHQAPLELVGVKKGLKSEVMHFLLLGTPKLCHCMGTLRWC